jgi:cation diffusion facilitator family transporter
MPSQYNPLVMPARKWIDDGYFVTDTRDLKQIRRVLIATMLLNFAATGIKLTVGLAAGALSVVADALDSLFDGLSNVAGLVGMRAAARPPDADHPYGHRKFETIAALSIAFLLFLTSWQLLQTAWGRWQSDTRPEITWGTGLAMLAGMLIQAVTSYYELRQGRRLNSEVLVADAMHTRASILVSASVLGGMGLIALGFPVADPLLAAFVAVMIARVGVSILRENLPVLLDQAAFDPRKIAGIVESVGGIESFHRVRSRGAAGSAAIDLHIRVSPDDTVQEANAIADEVRRRLLELQGVGDVTVHVEAERQRVDDAADLFATVKHAARELGLTIHEVWAHRQDSRLFLEMHVGVEPDLTLGEAHELVDRLEREVKARLPEVGSVHTHIELATSQVVAGGDADVRLETEVHTEVDRAVAEIPSLSRPHNIRLYRNPADADRIYLSLECTIAPEVPVTQAHQLASQLEQELSRRLTEVANVSVHLEPPDQE